MGLSCACNEWDGGGWYFLEPNDYSKLLTKRRKRCVSCKSLIALAATCLEFERYRSPTSDVEAKIYGEDCIEIAMASYFMCETCGDIYYSLTELGFCVTLGNGESMQELLKEYQEEYGPGERCHDN